MSEKVGFTEYKMEMLRCGSNFRWRRNDGEWVSPIFTTPEAAHYFAGRIPFLTDAEWKEEQYSVTGDPLLLREYIP